MPHKAILKGGTRFSLLGQAECMNKELLRTQADLGGGALNPAVRIGKKALRLLHNTGRECWQALSYQNPSRLGGKGFESCRKDGQEGSAPSPQHWLGALAGPWISEPKPT